MRRQHRRRQLQAQAPARVVTFSARFRAQVAMHRFKRKAAVQQRQLQAIRMALEVVVDDLEGYLDMAPPRPVTFRGDTFIAIGEQLVSLSALIAAWLGVERPEVMEERQALYVQTTPSVN